LLVAAPLHQPQFIAFAAFHRLLRSRGFGLASTSIGAALAWVACEWLVPRLFEDSLGHGLFAFATLRQGADIAGVLGLTFLIVVVNQAVHTAAVELRRDRRRSCLALAAAAFVVGSLAAYGSLRLRQEAEIAAEREPFRAALVQADLSDYEGMRRRIGAHAAVRTILDAHEDLSRRALARSDSDSSIDMLIWPETVYPTTFGAPKSSAGEEFDRELESFAAAVEVPFLFGTYRREGAGEFNVAVLLQPGADGATASQTYAKQHLFPLTEHVPAWLDRPALRKRFGWWGTWQPGSGTRTLEVKRAGGPPLRIAPLICLDAVDPALALRAADDGAQLLVTLSNDGWFAAGPGPMLHLIVSAFRSIETRLPQLRATNTGISAIISTTGELVSQTGVDEAVVLAGAVFPGPPGSTLMRRWGDWFGPAAVFATLLLGLIAARRTRTTLPT